MLEDEELGQLGVIEYMTDAETEWQLRAKYRLESRKNFVKQDCSQRYARAMLRSSGPIPGVYRQGDLIMYKVEQQSDGIEDQRWHGPARILGLDGKVIWCLHEGTPVAASTGRSGRRALRRSWPIDMPQPVGAQASGEGCRRAAGLPGPLFCGPTD